MRSDPATSGAGEAGARVTLAHGSGGRAARQLLHDVIEAAFGPEVTRDDSAVLAATGGRIALTTDSFVVSPRFFPGGNIGTLSVYGTVNDLAVSGAVPSHLSVSLILEEGLELGELAEICAQMAGAAQACGVRIVTGDTKVVPRGQADGIYVTTSGVGFVPEGVALEQSSIVPGDVIVLNGDVGRHGACVAGSRQSFGLEHSIESDCAPLAALASAMIAAGGVRYLRDATRGGLASVCNELAVNSGTRFRLVGADIPVQPAVRALCEVLGLDPVHLACEGRLVGVVAADHVEAVLDAMRAQPAGTDSRVIGAVLAGCEPPVSVMTYLGVETVLSMPAGELLPRIC